MAKKKKKQPADPNWWKRLPTQGEWGRFEQAQRNQFNPMIRELSSQVRGFIPRNDPRVLELDRLIGGEKSVEDIKSSFAQRLSNLSQYMQGIDMARQGKGVSSIIEGIGGALGVEGASDVAAEAGAVSGIGGGEDIYSKALMTGAASQFAGLESDTLKDRSNRLMQLGMSRADALSEARRERRDMRLRLADVRGQRAGAVPNPLERSMGFLQLAGGLRDFDQSGRGGYGGGYGGGYAGGTGGDTGAGGGNVGVTEREILSWMQDPKRGGFGIIGKGGLGSEAAARGEFRNKNRKKR
jgi:hypothetical protein